MDPESICYVHPLHFLSEAGKRTTNQADAVTEWRKIYNITFDIYS